MFKKHISDEEYNQQLQEVFSDLKSKLEVKQKENIKNFFEKNREQRIRVASKHEERLSRVECVFDVDNAAIFEDSLTQNKLKKTFAKATWCFNAKKNISIISIAPVTFLSAATPIPAMTVYNSIRKNCRAEDESKLVNMPYISDEVIEKSKFVENLENHFQGFVDDEESRSEQTIGDELFVNLVQAMIPHQNADSSRLDRQKIFQAISQTLYKNKVDPAKLQARYFRLIKTHDPENEKMTPNIDGPMEKPALRENVLKSYKVNFCRRCFIYGCQIHEPSEIPSSPTKPCINTLYAQAKPLPCGENCYMFVDGAVQPPLKAAVENAKESGTSANKTDQIWTASDESVFNLFRPTMTNCQIAIILGTKACNQVYEFAKTVNENNKKTSSNSSLLVDIPNVSTSGIKTEGGTKPGNKEKLQHMTQVFAKQDEHGRNNYTSPCNHDGPCSIDNKECKCIESSNFCEKFCGCSQSCRNRFPGCICKGKCITKQCVCFSVNRECDPDLCKKCGSHEFDVSQVNCKNVNVQRHLNKHILLGKSDVSGWGAFIKDAAKKHEFIYEYTGELISKSEGNRRAAIYDERKHTFLFHLNNQFDVDAMRKGNKIRFANSSSQATQANLYCRVVMVNGDHRIAIFAARDIAAGEELILDYHWDSEIQEKFGIKVSKKETRTPRSRRKKSKASRNK